MSNTNAQEIILWTKNRLNNFCNPKLWEPGDLDEAEYIAVNFGGNSTTDAPGGVIGTGIGFV